MKTSKLAESVNRLRHLLANCANVESARDELNNAAPRVVIALYRDTEGHHKTRHDLREARTWLLARVRTRELTREMQAEPAL